MYLTVLDHDPLLYFLYNQEVMTFAENFPFEFRLFTGEIVKLNPDGSFSVDGVTCQGLVFTGAEDCR